jgi:hypothetical protein
MDERNAEPLILVQGLDNLPIAVLKDDLERRYESHQQAEPGTGR